MTWKIRILFRLDAITRNIHPRRKLHSLGRKSLISGLVLQPAVQDHAVLYRLQVARSLRWWSRGGPRPARKMRRPDRRPEFQHGGARELPTRTSLLQGVFLTGEAPCLDALLDKSFLVGELNLHGFTPLHSAKRKIAPWFMNGTVRITYPSR